MKRTRDQMESEDDAGLSRSPVSHDVFGEPNPPASSLFPEPRTESPMKKYKGVYDEDAEHDGDLLEVMSSIFKPHVGEPKNKDDVCRTSVYLGIINSLTGKNPKRTE
jgi:hypothetical protein